jgi:ABC-2 type transport system permease protein
MRAEPIWPAAAGLPVLLAPKLAGPRGQLRARPSLSRATVLGGAGLVFWGALFAILYRVLAYFQGADALGDVLAARLLGLILLTLLGVLLLSNVIAALSTFFLDRDLELFMAAPLDGLRFYAARLTETLAQSSWMVVLVLVPILTAYGVVYEGGALYVATVALTIR